MQKKIKSNQINTHQIPGASYNRLYSHSDRLDGEVTYDGYHVCWKKKKYSYRYLFQVIVHKTL